MMDVFNVWAFKMCMFSVYEWEKSDYNNNIDA